MVCSPLASVLAAELWKVQVARPSPQVPLLASATSSYQPRHEGTRNDTSPFLDLDAFHYHIRMD